MGDPKKREYFDLHKFAIDIERRRSEKGFTQAEMAAYLGVHRFTIIRIEDETNIPTPENLFRICRILGFDSNDYRIKTSNCGEDDYTGEDENELRSAFDSEAFRRDLREARISHSMLQDDLAETYHIKRTAYGAIERTGKLSTEMLYKLADIFHIKDLNKYIKRQ